MLFWAYGMWFSRRFPTALASHGKNAGYRWQRRAEEEMEEESDGEGAMVPFMDFTNHRSGTKIVWSADDEHVTFTAGEPGVEEGAEAPSNEDLLLIHGFALLDNIYDTYGLWLSVQVSEEPPTQRPKKKRRASPKTQRIGPFLLRRSDPRLVDFTATKTRDRHFASGGAAEGGALDPRIRYIARYRDGQRQVLEDCAKALDEMLSQLPENNEAAADEEAASTGEEAAASAAS
eukprot:s226_g17.t1